MTDETQGADVAEEAAPTKVTTRAFVHSYDEGDCIITATLANGDTAQVKAHGATVELVDDNGSAHTHRLLDIGAARAVFGIPGTEVAITYEAVAVPEGVTPLWERPEPAPAAEPVAEEVE